MGLGGVMISLWGFVPLCVCVCACVCACRRHCVWGCVFSPMWMCASVCILCVYVFALFYDVHVCVVAFLLL